MMIHGLAFALALAQPPAGAEVAPPEPALAPTEPAAGEEEPTVALADALEVRAGATCLERERLVTQIRTWFDRGRIDARLVVEVVGDEHDARKLAFTIRRGEQVIAVRRFEPAPDRCADLHAVVGLAIALAIDATLLESVAGDPSATKPPKRPPEQPPPKQIPPKKVPPPKPRDWRLWAELTAQLTIGIPPDVGGGGRFGLRASWRRLLDLGVSGIAMSSGRERIGAGSALLSAAAGRLDLCAGPPWVRLRPRGCVGVIAGQAFAAGQGFDRDRSTRIPWLAIPFGIDLEVQLAPRVGLLVGIEGVPQAIRPTFEADSGTGVRAVRRFARFGGIIEAGLSFLLW